VFQFQGKDLFFGLAQALCSCLNSNQKWRDSMLVTVLDQLFLMPKAWPIENIAGFLLFCSEPVSLKNNMN
jgi:hypothetical protein